MRDLFASNINKKEHRFLREKMWAWVFAVAVVLLHPSMSAAKLRQRTESAVENDVAEEVSEPEDPAIPQTGQGPSQNVLGQPWQPYYQPRQNTPQTRQNSQLPNQYNQIPNQYNQVSNQYNQIPNQYNQLPNQYNQFSNQNNVNPAQYNPNPFPIPNQFSPISNQYNQGRLIPQQYLNPRVNPTLCQNPQNPYQPNPCQPNPNQPLYQNLLPIPRPPPPAQPSSKLLRI